MNRDESLHGLQLEEKLSADENVDAIAAVELNAFIPEGHCQVSNELDLLKKDLQAFRASRCVLDRCSLDLIRHTVKKRNHACIKRVLRPDDDETVVGDQPFEDIGSMSKMIR